MRYYVLIVASCIGFWSCGATPSQTECPGGVCSNDEEARRCRHSGCTTPTPTPTPSGCTAVAESWANASIDSQSGHFTAGFDVTPAAANLDLVLGLSSAAAATYSDLATIVRFNDNGTVDARSGGDYTAASAIAYTAGTQYHVRFDVDIASSTYSAYITSAGASEQTIGEALAFRSEQTGVTALANIGGAATLGSSNMCAVTVSATAPSTPPPSDPPPTPPTSTITHGSQVNGANTGVPAGTALTPISGSISIDQDGTIWEGYDLTGGVYVQANNVTIRNSRITATGYFGINNQSGTNLTIENVEVVGTLSGNYTGIAGSDMHVTRVNVWNFENGFAIGGNSIIEESWIHDPQDHDGAHIDGIEWIPEGSNTIIRRNNIQIVDETGCVNMTPWAGGAANHNTVQDNQFAGGTYSLYIRGDGGGSVDDVTVTGNIWLVGTPVWGPSSIVDVTNVHWSNNAWSDGTPIDY